MASPFATRQTVEQALDEWNAAIDALERARLAEQPGAWQRLDAARKRYYSASLRSLRRRPDCVYEPRPGLAVMQRASAHAGSGQ